MTPAERSALALRGDDRTPAADVSAPVTGVPPWVAAIDQPVWVTGPDHRLRYVNRKAETLLGIRASDWLGRPCHLAVASRDGTGRPFCGGRCAIKERAACGAALAPVEFAVGPHGDRARWARITAIPVAAGGGAPWIVHVATDLGRTRRVEAWLERIAARSDPIRKIDLDSARRPLTPRESEILDLLAADDERPRIAHRLGISRATVRNHVQRALAAIGAHSVQEAVALRLLGRA